MHIKVVMRLVYLRRKNLKYKLKTNVGLFNLIDLVYYEGPKISYDLIKKIMFVWYDEKDSYEEYLLLNCRDSEHFNLLMKYLTNGLTLKDLILEVPLQLCKKYFNGTFEVVKMIDDISDLVLPTDNSYLGFSFLDNYEMAKEGNYDVKSIIQYGEQISKKYQNELYSMDDLMLVDFVKKFGGNVHFIGIDLMNKTEYGSVVINNKNDFDIFLPDYAGIESRRLTVAHELGHYLIHSDGGKKQLKAARHGTDRCEMEANLFAMSLLVPKKAFDDTDSNEEIANKYFVSVDNAGEYRRFLSELK